MLDSNASDDLWFMDLGKHGFICVAIAIAVLSAADDLWFADLGNDCFGCVAIVAIAMYHAV